jgi:hypothetical protein
MIEQKTMNELVLESEQTALVLQSNGLRLSSLEYSPENRMEDMLKGAEVLIDSGILPNRFTEPSQVVAVSKMGHEYGLPSLVAMNNIDMIEGKACFNVHLIGAILQRGGWEFNVVEDFAVDPNNPNDVRTTVEFINMNALQRWKSELMELNSYSESMRGLLARPINILEKTVVKRFSFYWSEAYAMKLTTKGNWEKMPKIMLRTRAITLGCRLVAPKLMMGMMETSEWMEVKNLVHTIDEDGIVVVE